MHTGYKIAAASCAVGIGLVLLSVGLTRGDVQKFNSKNINYESHTYECQEKVNRIEVYEDSNGLRIVSGNVDRPVVKYTESDLEKYEVTENNGTLQIEKKSKNGISFSFFTSDHDTVITVPKNYLGEIKAYNDCGSVEVDNVKGKDFEISSDSGSIKMNQIECKNLKVDGDAGSISIDELSGERMEVKATSGSIKMKNMSATDLNVDNDCGGIELSDVSVKEKLQLKNESGRIELDDVTALDDLKIENDCGSIKMNNVETKGEIYAHNESGSIHFKSLSFAKGADFATSAGSINGTVSGKESDYHIDADSDVGSCNLKSGGTGTIPLKVKADFGSINIDFR